MKQDKEIPQGSLFFNDNYIPSLKAGNWKIHIEQLVEKDGVKLNLDKNKNPVPYEALQEFIVSAPQFHLPSSAIAGKFPPENSTGLYRDVLPHIVLADPLLPWERQEEATTDRPWLALLVLTEDELDGASGIPTRTIAGTVGGFLKPETGVLKPKVEKEKDIDNDMPCAFIRIPVKTFTGLAPLATELELLAHCRKLTMEDKAESTNGNGFFSVVVANRFPASPAEKETVPKKNIVHLVSFEGFGEWLTAKPDFKNYTHVSLLSLASWTFSVVPEKEEDFSGLAGGLVGQAEKTTSVFQLPVHSSAKVDTATSGRLQNGFIPLPYHTRTGEETPAWYRGPFTPVIPAALKKEQPFLSSDAALIYDKTQGVFDVSLASAWTIGRAVALSDKNFAGELYEHRRKLHRTADLLHYRLNSRFFSKKEIAEITEEDTIQHELAILLGKKLIAQISKKPGPKKKAVKAKLSAAPKTLDAFLSEKKVQQMLLKLSEEKPGPVSEWLARLALLYPVPFNYLVPHEKLLPEEAIRFFYVDPNWISALLDGALSIGLESARETKMHLLLNNTIQQAALKVTATLRAKHFGKTPEAFTGAAKPVCGLLLRSKLVSGWPALSIRPFLSESDTPFNVLRMEHISSTILLCLFDRVPDYIEISEPYESLRFGTDAHGQIPLRWLTPPAKKGDAETGEQLTGDPVLKVRDISGKEMLGMRAAGSRTLNLSPADPQSLVSRLKTVNNTFAPRPSFLALQMIKSPEAIRFITQNKKTSR